MATVSHGKCDTIAIKNHFLITITLQEYSQNISRIIREHSQNISLMFPKV